MNDTEIPAWLVERAALDEVPAASRARLAEADPAMLAARVAALRAEDAAELARYPAGPAVAAIEARVHARAITRRRRRLAILAGALGAACITIVAVRALPSDPPAETERAKGASRVAIYRHAGDHAELLVEDALVRPGDVLQLRYKPERARHGVIASLDGAGEVTLHFPASERDSTALAKEATSLPHSYALDDAPRFERFFFITADEPIEVGRVLDTLRSFAPRTDSATAEPALPEGLAQWSLRLRKPEQKAAP